MAGESESLILCTGKLELVLAPENGGSILRFDHVAPGQTRIPILRGSDSPDASVLAVGSFPLVPYCNRIRGGSFEFRGRTIRQPLNMEGDASPLHGHGWLHPWTVEEQTTHSARLRYRHQADEWPWTYEAVQIFRLDETGLDMQLSCRNLADAPMPCGLGFHPYFHCTGETLLDTGVEDVWTIDADVLPVDRVPASGRYELSQRRICGQDLDNGFSRWSRMALIQTPGVPFTIRVTSPEATFFQIYSPPEGEFFVAEPVSHANAALNDPEEKWDELGLRVLGVGEEMVLNARIDLSAAE